MSGGHSAGSRRHAPEPDSSIQDGAGGIELTVEDVVLLLLRSDPRPIRGVDALAAHVLYAMTESLGHFAIAPVASGRVQAGVPRAEDVRHALEQLTHVKDVAVSGGRGNGEGGAGIAITEGGRSRINKKYGRLPARVRAEIACQRAGCVESALARATGGKEFAHPRELLGRLPAGGGPERGRGDAGRTGPACPRSGPAGVSAWTEAHLRYSRQNIERSRRLFDEGDLRYALFSANEGLELCAKAYMLHYNIIDEAKDAKHFPYPAVVEDMMRITELNIRRDPPHKKKLEQVLCLLSDLEKAFSEAMDKDLKTTVWKLSLNMPLRKEEIKQVDILWQKFSSWGEKMVRLQGGQKLPYAETCEKHRRNGQDACLATVIGPDEIEKARKKSSKLLDSARRKNRHQSTTVDTKQIVAIVDIIMCVYVIVRSFVHQQTSRYPTQIDGVDSEELYTKHKDDVESLLEAEYICRL